MYIAHVKWFVDSNLPHSDAAELNALQLILVALAVILGLGVLRWLHQAIEQSRFARLGSTKLWSYLPLIIRGATGIWLLLNFFDNTVFAPNFDTTGVLAPIISFSGAVIGVLLIVGALTRWAGAGLLVLYLLGLWQYGPFDMLDHLEYIGLGLYLWLAGAGQYSLDQKMGWDQPSTADNQLQAARQLQIWTGAAIVSAALSEKLLAIGLASDFLQLHHWNLLASFGVSDQLFIVIAGIMELVVGLSFMLGWAMRLSVLALIGLMTTTAILLGLQEVVGHLFAIPLLASIWLIPPDKRTK